MRWSRLVVVGALLVAGGATVAGCGGSSADGPVPVTWHLGTYTAAALPRVAAEAGFFSDEGLDVTLMDYSQGVDAFEGFLADPGVAFVSASEVVMAENALSSKDFRVIASDYWSDNYYEWVIRSGPGVSTIGDLKGARVGLPPMSALRAFGLVSLASQGLRPGVDFEVVEVPFKDMPVALAAGRIDAHPSREPVTAQSMAALNGTGITQEVAGEYSTFNMIATTTGVLQDDPVVVEKTLAALVKAPVPSASLVRRSEPQRCVRGIAH